MKTLKDLIGCQLVNINDTQIIVKKKDKEYVLDIIQDEGGCCGYNELTTALLIEKNNANNPIITNVEYEKNGDSQCKVTFYGADKPIATMDSLSYSGSGWTYGACVEIKCKDLNIEETITEW